MLGAAAIALHFLLPSDTAVYDAIGLSAAGAIVFGTIVHRPRRWQAWAVIAASQVTMSCGDLVYDNVTTRYPGPADAFYLGAVVLLAAGVLMLAGTAPRRSAQANIDALLVTVAGGIAVWALVFDGVGSSSSWIARTVSYAYPLSDLVVLGLVARLLLIGGRRGASFWFLVGAAFALFAADAVWVVPALDGSYDGGTSWMDAGWLGSYVLLGAAALHPSMREPVRATRSDSTSVNRVLVIGAAITFAPVAVVIADVSGRAVNLQAAAAAGTVLVALVVARFVLIVRDLERLRGAAVASERKFRMIFEGAPIGISVGRDGIMSETNPALQRMLGFTGDEFARMHFNQVTHPDDRELSVQRELDAGKRDAFSIDKRYVAKDGRVVDTHVHIALDVEDGLGISLLEDVTDRRRLEADLREAQKMEAVGKLAGGVAHDFNNLMTAVLGYSDLILARLAEDDPNRGKIESIREASVRASDLTRQLLAFGRKQMLQTADVDLRDIVAGLDHALRRIVGDDVELTVRLADEPVVVRGDPVQLEQVVRNLAANAREAMPAGGSLGIDVTIEGDDAVLVVEDTGAGIDETILGRIFEPFFTTKPVGAGPGLGLSTVHGIVGQSGGSVEVESAPGRGTAFVVRLPLVAARPERSGLPVDATAASLVD